MTRPDIALDMHTHLIFADNLREFDDIVVADGSMTIDKAPLEAGALLQPEALISWLDHNRIHRAWISPPPPVYRPLLAEDEAYSWARALTAGLAEIASKYSDRLAPLGFLPVEHPQAASALVRESGDLQRFEMSTGGRGVVLSEPEYDCLWQTLHNKNALLFLHPGRGVDARLAKFYLRNLLGNPNETALATAHLVLGGVIEKYPNINFVLSHGGGTVPAIAGRWQHAYDQKCHGINTDISPPAKQLRKIWADCVTHGRTGVEAAIEVFGKDHIVFGSDWPFPMGMIDPHTRLTTFDSEIAQSIQQTNSIALERL